MTWVGPDIYHFEFPMRIVPYTRTTRKSLWTERSQRYASSKAEIQLRTSQKMAAEDWPRFVGRERPLIMTIDYEAKSHLHQADFDNIEKAILDGMQKIAFDDDRYVDAVLKRRRKTTRWLAKVSVAPLDYYLKELDHAMFTLR